VEGGAAAGLLLPLLLEEEEAVTVAIGAWKKPDAHFTTWSPSSAKLGG
jgi:hypothetical protein